MAVCPMCALCGKVFPSIEAMVAHHCPVKWQQKKEAPADQNAFQRDSLATGV